jgi:hypothetical protein
VEWLKVARRSAGEVMAAMHEGVERWRALMTVPLAPKVAASVNSRHPAFNKTGALSVPRQPMRQGIASRFRHVAPALLLC